ncbi:MAG: hypothetical protein AB1763_07955 [Campylobacterota bacterium]
MNRIIERNEAIALFFRLYFLYADIAVRQKKTERERSRMNAYKILMRKLAYLSGFPRIAATELCAAIRSTRKESTGMDTDSIGEVIGETLTFIHEHVLLDDKEGSSLHERYA